MKIEEGHLNKHKGIRVFCHKLKIQFFWLMRKVAVILCNI